jgi:hypothetical protein
LAQDPATRRAPNAVRLERYSTRAAAERLREVYSSLLGDGRSRDG